MSENIELNSNSQFAILAMDIYNIREKLNNQEYLEISNKLKGIKDHYDKEQEKKLKLFKEYYKLQKDYIKIGNAFTHMYTDSYDFSDNDNEFIQFR